MWSFDVFDTCLVRRHAVPTDVFLTLANRLENQLKPALGTDYAQIFLEIRTSAESLAIKKSGKEEVTLEEIWLEVGNLVPNLDIKNGLNIELEIEASTLHPVASTLSLVNEARKKFGKIIYISDTYLPAFFIEQQLERYGFLDDKDFCFVSSDYKKTKRSSSLYREVIDNLGISPKKITHHGDNLDSDVLQAKACGLNTVHIQNAHLNSREKEIGKNLINISPSEVSKIIGSMRASRVSGSNIDSESCQSLVSSFIGPYLWILANWILNRAETDGIKRLYFFSRDCHGLSVVATEIARRQKLDIECRYLKVSRQALLLPSIKEISPAGIPWLRRSWENGRLGNIAGKLDIDVNLLIDSLAPKIPGIDKEYCLGSDQDWDIFWDALNSINIKNVLNLSIVKRRSAALQYFEQEGMFDSVNSAMVDLGWHQSCQYALASILKTKDSSFVLPAYYLALVNNRSNYLKEMPAQALFHRAPHDRRITYHEPTVFSRIGLLEHVLNCAPHGTVHHYDSNIETGLSNPICLHVDEEEILAKEQLLSSLKLYASHHTFELNLSDDETRLSLNALLHTCGTHPDKKWTSILKYISVADDQNNYDRSSMIKSLTFKNLIVDFANLRDLKRINIQSLGIWPELSLIGSNNSIINAYKFLGQILDIARSFRNSLLLKS